MTPNLAIHQANICINGRSKHFLHSIQHLPALLTQFGKLKPTTFCIAGPVESLVTAWDRLTQQQSSDNDTPVQQWTGQTQGQIGDNDNPVRHWAGQLQGQSYDSDPSVRSCAGQTQKQSVNIDSDTPVRQWTGESQGQLGGSDSPVRQQTAQTLALPLPHRNRDRGTNLLRKLFGPAWHREVMPEARLQVMSYAVILG